MATQIQPLSPDLVHLMAAGEVIDSLGAVVRELAENALDAGATRLVISLWPEQWRIAVSDNGTGMALEDLQQAATPHTTSKIRREQDFRQITTLGFRGEALHGLAQLSHLEICSRTPHSAEGWRVGYGSAGEIIKAEPVAIAPGTIVRVANLFHTWPDRRQSLRLSQQLRTVQHTIYHLALCHPQVTWQVEQNDREWFALWSGTTAKEVLLQILKDVQPGDVMERSLSFPPSAVNPHPPSSAPAALHLLLGLPNRCHRHRPDWVKIAVNGRMVKLPELEQTILRAFRRTLPRDRHPVALVHLRLAPQEVDWNRHPAKLYLYLHHLSEWQERVQNAIPQTLQAAMVLPDEALAPHLRRVVTMAETGAVYGSDGSQGSKQDAEGTMASQRGDRQLDSATALPVQENLLSSPLAPLPTPLTAIAQVHQRYILAEHPAGIWLIEQHIAHERVLYEQLRDRWQLVECESPIILHHLSSTQIDQLHRLGLSVDPFGEDLWAVRTLPAPLQGRSDCVDAVLELSYGGDLEAALVAIACRTAIRNGTVLSLSQMQILLNQWQRTRHPQTCPHGRPIYLSLQESSLSRFFRRHWVIGKSHGI